MDILENKSVDIAVSIMSMSPTLIFNERFFTIVLIKLIFIKSFCLNDQIKCSSE